MRIFSSIQPVKEIAERCGWNGTKTEKDRKFLSDLKQLLIDYNDYPYNEVVHYIEMQRRWFENRDYDTDRLVFFIDVREPNEINKLRKKYGADAILIKRAGLLLNTFENEGDKEENFNERFYDMVITNDGTLDQLEAQAREFMKKYKYNM